MDWGIASTITQAASSVAILGVTFYFNRSIKNIEKERREEEEKNGRHERNQIRFKNIQELSAFIKRVNNERYDLNNNFIEENETNNYANVFSVFYELEVNHEKKTNNEIIEKVQEQINQEISDEAIRNLFLIMNSINEISIEIYDDLLMNLKAQSLIQPELFEDSFDELKNLVYEREAEYQGYEEYAKTFTELYLYILKLEKAILNLKRDLESKLEKNP